MSKDVRNLLDHICGQEKKDWFIEFCFADIGILSGKRKTKFLAAEQQKCTLQTVAAQK